MANCRKMVPLFPLRLGVHNILTTVVTNIVVDKSKDN